MKAQNDKRLTVSHIKSAALLIVVLYLLLMSQCYGYEAAVRRTTDGMRLLGERIVYGRMTLEEAKTASWRELEEVGPNEYSTVESVDHWLNVLDHDVYLQIRFIEGRAVAFRVYDSARAL